MVSVKVTVRVMNMVTVNGRGSDLSFRAIYTIERLKINHVTVECIVINHIITIFLKNSDTRDAEMTYLLLSPTCSFSKFSY